MNYLELLKNSYKQVSENHEEQIGKLEYLSIYIFDFTTYDSNVDELFAKKALEVCIAITNRKTFDYQEDFENYKWYLIMCNMPFFAEKLEWGTSIRGAWWNFGYKGKFMLRSCGIYKEFEQILEIEFNKIQWNNFIYAIREFVEESEEI